MSKYSDGMEMLFRVPHAQPYGRPDGVVVPSAACQSPTDDDSFPDRGLADLLILNFSLIFPHIYNWRSDGPFDASRYTAYAKVGMVRSSMRIVDRVPMSPTRYAMGEDRQSTMRNN